jgi:hypothetical protein
MDRRDRVKHAIAEAEHELEAAKRLTQARAAAKKLQRARQELRSFEEAAAKIREYIRDIPAGTAGVTALSLLVSITYNLFYFLGVTPSAKALGPGSLLSLLTLSDHHGFRWLSS